MESRVLFPDRFSFWIEQHIMCLKFVFTLSILVVFVVGCRSRDGKDDTTHSANAASDLSEANMQHDQFGANDSGGEPFNIQSADAVEIVRDLVAKELKQAGLETRTFPVFKVTDNSTEFRVHVEYGTKRDSEGNVSGFFPGGHAVYVISEDGKLIRVIGGS